MLQISGIQFKGFDIFVEHLGTVLQGNYMSAGTGNLKLVAQLVRDYFVIRAGVNMKEKLSWLCSVKLENV